MAKFDPAQAADAVALHQLVADWCYALDIKNCTEVELLCTEDVEYWVGGKPNHGRAAVAAFYAARNERVAKLQRDGVRTQRHSVSNFRIVFTGPDSAKIEFLLVNYSAEGPAPALNLVGPTIIADTRFECVRADDGEWMIALFDSTPVFVGNDPFLNASVAPK